MAQVIQLRRDSAADWTSANPTLAQGEAGYETDTGKMKVGDGATAWTSLGYLDPAEAAADLATHIAAGDPHPGYLLESAAIAGYQPLDSDLTAIAALTTTSFGRGLLELANAGALRTSINVEDGAEANDVDSVNSQTGVVVLDADDIDDTATTNKFATAAQLSAVDGLAATYQPLDSDLTAIAALTTTSFGRGLLALADAAALRTSLNVEDGADATDTANVTAAGALMDSEVDADIKTLALPANTTISTFGASLVDDADAATARTTLGALSSASGAVDTTNLADEAVTLAKMANLATDRIIGRVSSGTGVPEALTPAQVREVAQAMGPVYDVTHYGATGDGSTDDTAAIQAAIDAAEATGGVLFVPALSYNIASPLVVGNPTHRLLVEATGARFNAASTSQAAVLVLWTDGDKIVVNGLAIAGAGTGGSTAGIDLRNCKRATIRNVDVTNIATGIAFTNDGSGTYGSNHWNEDNRIIDTVIGTTATAHLFRVVSGGLASFAATRICRATTSNSTTHYRVDATCSLYRSSIEGTCFFDQVSGSGVTGVDIAGQIDGTLFALEMEETSAGSGFQPFRFRSTASQTQHCRIICHLTGDGFASPAVLNETTNGAGPLHLVTADGAGAVPVRAEQIINAPGSQLGFFGAAPVDAPVVAGYDGVPAALATLGLVKDRGAGFQLAGASAEYLSTPDAAALDITGDIDIRVNVALDDWTPASFQQLIAKDDGGNFGYALGVMSSGVLRFTYGNGSGRVDIDSSVAVGASDGESIWVRLTMDAANGSGDREFRFWTSTSGDYWVQLGTTATGSGAASIGANAVALTVGRRSAGGSELPVSGVVYDASVRDGIDGTIVARMDASDASDASSTWVGADDGLTWTPNGTIELVGLPPTYAPTNVTTDRAFDADTVAIAELADVVGTLIADLKTSGIIL